MSISHNAKIWVVGFGQMGQALARGWLAQGDYKATEILALDPHPAAAAVAQDWGLGWAAHQPATGWPEVVVFALKPQVLLAQAAAYHAVASAGSLCISIAAGVTTTQLRQALGEGAIVRAMPNLPAQIGQGMTVCFTPTGLPAAQQALLERLFNAVGEVAWVPHEDAMAAVTAVAGSGPAYQMQLTEAMRAAAIQMGLAPALAQQLTLQTLRGAAQMAWQLQAERSPAQLCAQVTSPQGTTAAALEVLATQGFSRIIGQAVQAAADRARALANGA